MAGKASCENCSNQPASQKPSAASRKANKLRKCHEQFQKEAVQARSNICALSYGSGVRGIGILAHGPLVLTTNFAEAAFKQMPAVLAVHTLVLQCFTIPNFINEGSRETRPRVQHTL